MSSEPDLPGDLLALAREDLASAEALHRAERVSDSPVGFHAQQAVEKALKAAIASRGLEFPFTHDLGVLMQLCEDAGLELPAALSDADRLNPYAATIRYGLGDRKRSPRKMLCDGLRLLSNGRMLRFARPDDRVQSDGDWLSGAMQLSP